MIKGKEIHKAVGQIGYEIIDIIGLVAGIKDIVADLFLADISCYMCNEKERTRVARKIVKKYKLEGSQMSGKDDLTSDYIETLLDVSIASVVFYILEEKGWNK